jgi:alkanesulfonate monooxygenase SsuD/methylene tetrahydromethanopterin reductase-like flavin-dependent oxidoreductase (luciferase family)
VTSDASNHVHLAVALDGAGWHPAAWREPDARPSELFSPRYWVDLVRESEWGLLDFVTIEDSQAIQSTRRGNLDDRTDQVRGRLDAVLIAARVAPRTSGIGIIPVATTTHTEPFHVSKSIATLDYVSQGRAGLQARVSATALESRQFGDASSPIRIRPSPLRLGRTRSRISSTRPLISSRSPGDSGTAGKTMPRSEMSRPDGSSTGARCTTSTLRADGSR